ncbi:MAG: O-antigen ligase family protein [Planctomycetota bacterium]
MTPDGNTTVLARPLLGTPSWVSHAAAGFCGCALAVMPTSFAEVAIAFTGIAAFIHHRRWWASLRLASGRPVFWAVLAFIAWSGAALAWSEDRSLGFEEFGAARFWLLGLTLLALSDRRGLLIGGLIAGFAVGHVAQALNLWSLHGGGPEVFLFGRRPDRVSGWWDPAVAGTLLTIAACLHLPAAIAGRGLVLVAGLGGLLVSTAGLALSGSRGGWLATAAVVLLASAVSTLMSLPDLVAGRFGRVRWGGVGLIVGAASLLTVATFVRPAGLVGRFGALQETVEDLRDGDIGFDSDDGARLAMKLWAVDAFAAEPIVGVGTGGYSAWVRSHADAHPSPDPLYAQSLLDRRLHDHAHDTLLHIAASQGAIGALLGLGVALGVGIEVWKHLARAEGFAIYRAGPSVAALGLVAVSVFDTLHVSQSSTAVSCVVVALVLMPGVRTARVLAGEGQPMPSAM